MSEIIDASHRRRARKRLLSELLLESEWLMQRRPPTRHPTPAFPTAASFFGCAPAIYQPDPSVTTDESKTAQNHQLYTLAGPACILSAARGAGAETAKAEEKPGRQRVRNHWASLCEPQVVFGDDVDCDFNPHQCVVSEETEQASLQWVHDPFVKFNPAGTIFVATRNSPTSTTTARVLGDATPLSPVVQPFPFFSKRNRRRACPTHGHLDSVRPVGDVGPGSRAYRAAWDRAEPLTLPPTCSCHTESLTMQYQQMIKRIAEALTARLSEQPGSTPVVDSAAGEAAETGSPEQVLQEAQELLERQADCSVCGGLQYFPFSFVEVPLSHEVSSLLDFCERVPLPPKTEVFCDGPKVTACIICKSPQHEWEVYKALYAAKEHSRAAVYDVCTAHYFPGYKPSKLYWSRGTIKCSPQTHSTADAALSPLPAIVSPSSINSPRSINAALLDNPGEEEASLTETETGLQRLWRSALPLSVSPLQPPQAFPLNLARCEPHALFSPISPPALTTPELRRGYCISLREVELDPTAHISAAECESIENAHRERIQYPEAMHLQEEIWHLRRQNTLAEHKLTNLRQQAWSYRLTSPEFPVLSPKPQRAQPVVPLRPVSQQRRDPSERSSSRDQRRSPSTPPHLDSRNRSTKSRLPQSDCRKPAETAPRHPPNAYSSAAASRIHALRAGTNNQSHNDRR